MIASFTLAMGNIGAAKKLHFNLLTNKFHTPQSFFDTTPIGRIINRFSKDIYVIDEALPSTVLMFLGTFFVSLSTILVIVSSTPIFAVVIVPLAVIYVFVQVLGWGRVAVWLACQMCPLSSSFPWKCGALPLPQVACCLHVCRSKICNRQVWLVSSVACNVVHDEHLLLSFFPFQL